MPPGRWNEYRELILRELDRLQKWCETLTGENAQLSKDLDAAKHEFVSKVAAVEKEVAGIKIRVAIYAALGGGLVSVILWAINVFVLSS